LEKVAVPTTTETQETVAITTTTNGSTRSTNNNSIEEEEDRRDNEMVEVDDNTIDGFSSNAVAAAVAGGDNEDIRRSSRATTIIIITVRVGVEVQKGEVPKAVAEGDQEEDGDATEVVHGTTTKINRWAAEEGRVGRKWPRRPLAFRTVRQTGPGLVQLWENGRRVALVFGTQIGPLSLRALYCA
jgi:hypothetical protein